MSAGTLQLGDGTTAGATLGSGILKVAGTGVLALNLKDGETFSQNVTVSTATATVKAMQAGTTTVSGLISGLGGFTQSGPGTTILSTTAQTYTGATTVTAGHLQVDSSLAATGTVNVSGTGILAGIGSAGTVNVLAGGSISPGDPTISGNPPTPGTLAVGKLVLSAGANSDFRLGTPNVVGGGVNDLIAVAGNLTLAGNLNITALGGFGIGTYTLFTYNGTLTNTGFSAINGTGGEAITISTSTNHKVILTVLGSAVTQYWDGAGVIGNGSIGGGSGTWNNTTTNWTNGGGSLNSAWQGGTADFRTIGGTVMLGAPINAQGLIFGVTGYTLSGTSALNLVGTASTAPTVSVSAAGTTATISAPVTGIAGLAANGAGTLILTNAANTYTGGTTITNGVVQIGTTAAPGSIGGGPITSASPRPAAPSPWSTRTATSSPITSPTASLTPVHVDRQLDPRQHPLRRAHRRRRRHPGPDPKRHRHHHPDQCRQQFQRRHHDQQRHPANRHSHRSRLARLPQHSHCGRG